jgi:carboxymethylenebutenolidase
MASGRSPRSSSSDATGRIDYEHIYWDQASVLAQVGALDISMLPALGADQSRVLVDAGAPLNTLVRTGRR